MPKKIPLVSVIFVICGVFLIIAFYRQSYFKPQDSLSSMQKIEFTETNLEKSALSLKYPNNYKLLNMDDCEFTTPLGPTSEALTQKSEIRKWSFN